MMSLQGVIMRMTFAFQSATQTFKAVTGGSHALPYKAAMETLAYVNLKHNEVVWDIGCGIPSLAAAASVATGTTAVCTDIDDVHLLLKWMMQIAMGDANKSADLGAKLAVRCALPDSVLQEIWSTYFLSFPNTIKAEEMENICNAAISKNTVENNSSTVDELGLVD